MAVDWGDVTRYGLWTYAVLLTSWLIACIPFEICDRMRWFRRYLTQPKSRPVARGIKEQAFSMVVFNWAWLMPALVMASPILAFWFPDRPCRPSVLRFFVQVVACFLIDDVCFYAYHRALHADRWLFDKFHRPHHVFKAPFGWSSHAVHPVEMLLQSVGALVGPAALGLSLPELWAWLAVRQWQGVLDHIGYDFPFDPIGWVPGVGGTRFHDDHHVHVKTNFASVFSFIDDLMGTRYSPPSSTPAVESLASMQRKT